VIETVQKCVSKELSCFSETVEGSTDNSVEVADDRLIVFGDIKFEEFVTFDLHLNVADDSVNLLLREHNSNDDLCDDEENSEAENSSVQSLNDAPNVLQNVEKFTAKNYDCELCELLSACKSLIIEKQNNS